MALLHGTINKQSENGNENVIERSIKSMGSTITGKSHKSDANHILNIKFTQFVTFEKDIQSL